MCKPQEQVGAKSLENLAAVVNAETNLQVTVDRRIDLMDINKHRYPFLYMATGRTIELSDEEKNMVRTYCSTGGFWFLDFRRGRHIGDNEPLYSLMRVFNPNPGEASPEWVISLISSTHQVFHCFYDLKIPAQYHGGSLLSAIYFRNNLVGIVRLSPFDDYDSFFMNDFDRKLGINTVVYALTPGNWYDLNRRMAFHNVATGEYIEWYENGRMRFRGRTGASLAGYVPWLPESAVKRGRIKLFRPPKAVYKSRERVDPTLASLLLSSRGMGGVSLPMPTGIRDQMIGELMKKDSSASNPGNRDVSLGSQPVTEDSEWKLIPGTYLFVQNERIDSLSREKKLIIPFQGINNHGQHLVLWGDFCTYEGWYENGNQMFLYDISDSTFIEWSDTGKVIVSNNTEATY